MSNDATVSYEDDPDHMIIWLDAGIGDPDSYYRLKKAFSTTANPKNGTPMELTDKDYDEILRAEDSLPVNFESVRFFLAAFTNVADCIEWFERNQDKRIFFITSGSIGEIVVPMILEKFRRTFTDPITSEPYMFMYVFCGDIKKNLSWALEYSDYIKMFDFEGDLLACITRDIAEYYLTQGKRLLNEDPPKNGAAYHRLSWAHVLYQRYSKMENDPIRKELAQINELLERVEQALKSASDEDD